MLRRICLRRPRSAHEVGAPLVSTQARTSSADFRPGRRSRIPGLFLCTQESTMSPIRPIGIYYEHPDWFRPLFAELDRRRTPYRRIDAGQHTYDPSEGDGREVGLVFNRMSPSAYLRGH